MKNGSILIVDDNKSVLSALTMLLEFEFGKVHAIFNPNQLQAEFRKEKYDLVLLDMNFSAGIQTGNEGLYWLKEINKLSPQTEVVMLTAYADVDLAVKALKLGAADFIVKPWQNEKLVATLQATLKLSRSQQEINELQHREQALQQEFGKASDLIIGDSPAMRKVMRMVEKVANTDASVLLTGENGTGKAVIAQAIHRQSERSNKMMVTVDMGAIPASLFESELFGHKKGAFTDAKEDRVGKFKLAHQGTLFLDEIGNLSLPLQAKLLVALENRSVIPVGGDRSVPVDIRLISATNSKLDELITSGQFREDLLYRLNTISIELPPLRERKEDIEVLAGHFLRQFQKKYSRQSLRLSSQAVQKLTNYAWPGNIRELKHTLEKAAILAESDVLKADDFILKEGAKKGQEIMTIAEMEKNMIEEALTKYDGNLTYAAEKLGVSRQTLYNKIKKYAL